MTEIGGKSIFQNKDLQCLKFFKIFYLFIHERHRKIEADTQAEREAGSMQGAQCGTRSRDSGITP